MKSKGGDFLKEIRRILRRNFVRNASKCGIFFTAFTAFNAFLILFFPQISMRWIFVRNAVWILQWTFFRIAVECGKIFFHRIHRFQCVSYINFCPNNRCCGFWQERRWILRWIFFKELCLDAVTFFHRIHLKQGIQPKR